MNIDPTKQRNLFPQPVAVETPKSVKPSNLFLRLAAEETSGQETDSAGSSSRKRSFSIFDKDIYDKATTFL